MIHTCPTWFESETMRKCHVTVCPLLLARLSTNKSLTLAGQIVVEHALFEVAQVAPACFEPVAVDKTSAAVDLAKFGNMLTEHSDSERFQTRPKVCTKPDCTQQA